MFDQSGKFTTNIILHAVSDSAVNNGRETVGVALIFWLCLGGLVGCSPSKSSAPTQENLALASTDSLADELAAEYLSRDPAPNDWFEDVTPTSGIEFTYESGRVALQYTMVESFGGGIGLLDFDQDGDLDVVCAGGGEIFPDLSIRGKPCGLFRNEGDLKFTDITESAGLNVPMDYSHGITIGDVNNDGYPDLLVSCFGGIRLFQNDRGHRFVDVTADRFDQQLKGWYTSACFADMNRDGQLDLYLGGYLQWTPDPKENCLDPKTGLRDVCMPGNFEDAADTLFLMQADGKYVDASQEMGFRKDGKGLGVVAADFTENGLIDLYVANDVVRNFYYQNQAGRLVESAILSGNAGNEFGIPEGSMGVDAGDVNGDGRLDLIVTNYEFEDNALYLNEGQGFFTHATVLLGLAGSCRPYVGFGTKLADFNQDGWDDLIVINGHVTYRNRTSAYLQPSVLYVNQQGKSFQKHESPAPWFDLPRAGRGLACGDLNNDGALDFLVSEQDRPVSILKNRNKALRWMGFQLIGTTSGTDAIGARVVLKHDHRQQQKSIISGGSYLSHSDRRLVFAIPESAEQISVEIHWSNGQTDIHTDLAENEYNIIREEPTIETER